MKIGVRHTERAALEIFAVEYAPMALVAQGMTGFFGGRPRAAPSIASTTCLVDKAQRERSRSPRRRADPVADRRRGAQRPRRSARRRCRTATPRPPPAITVPLRRLAYARSGDKGDTPISA